MTNRERILSITDSSKEGRIKKILSSITKNYVLETSCLEDEDLKYGHPLTNIIVPAEEQKGRIVLMAHHDVFPRSKGYNDNSTGVSTLLRLQEGLPKNVELVFTDGEEIGGQGCRLYVENCMKRGDLNFEAINVDVVGLGNTIFYEAYGDPVSLFTVPKHVQYYESIPFSDSRVLEHYGIPNVLLLTGASPNTLIKKIFEAQHCNINDSKLDLISEETMDLVYETISTMIGSRVTC